MFYRQNATIRTEIMRDARWVHVFRGFTPGATESWRSGRTGLDHTMKGFSCQPSFDEIAAAVDTTALMSFS